jgi:uncharacterized protein
MTLYRLLEIDFEWDGDKAKTNIAKHQVRFEEAAEVFLDPLYLEVDASQNYELRDAVIGYSMSQRLLFVVYTERVNGRIRIISARAATNFEVRLYEER